MGATLSPFHAFLLLQGLETLSLRVERHVENALKVVHYLHNHPQVACVHHPSISEDAEQKRLYDSYFPKGGLPSLRLRFKRSRGGENVY